MEILVCEVCGKPYINKKWGAQNNSKCASCVVSAFRRKRKLDCIEYKGGKCIICGYNKSPWALAFHHINPSDKEFALSDKGLLKSWKRTIKELDKCVLVCHNCHSELHAGIIDIPR